MSRGGRRRGSGRKKKASTILKELELKNAHGEAGKSLRFQVKLRNDKAVPYAIRQSAAVDIMDRVWGKAKQRTEHSTEDGKPFEVRVINYASATETHRPT